MITFITCIIKLSNLFDIAMQYGAPFVSKLVLAVDYQVLYKSVRRPLI